MQRRKMRIGKEDYRKCLRCRSLNLHLKKIYQVEMPEELTDLFQEAYLAATRKEEEE